MNQRKVIQTHNVIGENDPWQALASAIIIQTVKDFRSYGRMQYRLRRKLVYEKNLTEEEKQFLVRRTMQYKRKLDDLRLFFRSSYFSTLCDLDGVKLLRRLEREIA